MCFLCFLFVIIINFYPGCLIFCLFSKEREVLELGGERDKENLGGEKKGTMIRIYFMKKNFKERESCNAVLFPLFGSR